MAIIELGSSFDEAQREQELMDSIIEKGDYQVTILKVTNKRNLAGDADYLSVELELNLPGSPLSGKKLWANVSYEGKGRIFFVRFLKAFDVGGWAETQFDTDSLIGLTATVSIGIKKYNDKDSNEVNF